MKLKEYQNMVYVNFLSVKLRVTVNNSRSRIVEGLVDDLIKQYERGNISRLEFVSKVTYRHEKE